MSSDTATIDAPETCVVCGCASTDIVGIVTTDRIYHVHRCEKCKLAFTLPRPTPEELTRFYDGTYFRRDAARVGGYQDYCLGDAEANARVMWTDFSRSFPEVAARRGSLLDFGCATGGFIDEARKAGWHVQGIDLSEDAVHRAVDVFNLRAIVGDIFDPRLVEAGYDLLTMWHVLEHVISPLAVLRRARELIADNGFLFIELPNWNSIARKLKGMRWLQLRPPEHINFFSPRSLAVALPKAGFRVVWSGTSYPSMTDRVHLKQHRSLSDYAAAAAGATACCMGLGGYARVLATKA